jgi:hypothetical protein
VLLFDSFDVDSVRKRRSGRAGLHLEAVSVCMVCEQRA